MGVQSRGDLTDETITVTKEGQWYVATDESSGIASQGETKVAALENLAEALSLHERPVPERDENTADPSTAPWF
ncbi:type II toxin-antitoxin system HicB family antitoxin [Natrinema hispanicum]|uniref:Type II toxin-antitoxin system HicB family antitoxin n=1 Tax=Natrinema hispanicum TaxID=392421 RepID=A0A1H9ZYY6_9EURY|nr:type II toxin-antitoxin system HicB family antitoxin [Natrinema hispanicum]SDC03911.1 hypothetical protein SAMN05192552_1001208 [Natrinema hispanicum]SES86114.1 hypothetical protein SAMN04488694_102141 [Natrinema hispanicum]